MNAKSVRLLIATATAGMLGMVAAQANLVVNPGFETGALPPWTGLFATVNNVDVHSGSFAAELSAPASTITQVLPIVGGATYAVDFWAASSGSGELTVTLDGKVVDQISFAGATPYTHYAASVTPVGPGSLTFLWSDQATDKAYVDDVNVVPEPTTMLAGAMLILPFGISAVRMLRRKH